MARQFNGTSDRMQSAATWNLSSFTQLTVCWWAWIDNYGANNDELFWESSANFNSNSGAIIANASSSAGFAGKITIGPRGVSGSNTITVPQPSSAAWHHLAATIDLSAWGTSSPASCAVRAVYIDGVSQTMGSNSLGGTAPTGFGNYTWNFMSRNGTTLFCAGRMAEFSIYSGVNLTADQIKAVMQKGPLRVLPGSLFRYIPTWGQATPEVDLSGNAAGLNVTGTTAVGHAPTSRFTDMILGPRNVSIPSGGVTFNPGWAYGATRGVLGTGVF